MITHKPTILNNLGNAYPCRFERLGDLRDINNAIERQIEAVSVAPDTHEDKSGMLNNLGNAYHRRFEQQGDLPDLSKAIECQIQAVSLAPDARSEKPGLLNDLGSAYQCRFERLGDFSDINKAIESSYLTHLACWWPCALRKTSTNRLMGLGAAATARSAEPGCSWGRPPSELGGRAKTGHRGTHGRLYHTSVGLE